MSSSIGEALELVEHRHVRGVRRVGPVHAARHDDVDRRLLRLHRAHLHRRGVRAQQHVLGQVEGVLRRPRRVLRRVVERGEVVVLVLDLRALEHREAEPDEDVLHLAPDLGDQVQAAGRLRRVARQRHVDAVLGQAAVELRGLELRGPLLEQLLERHAHLVGRLAHRPALLGRQLADRAQRRGQLGLAAEVAHPQLLELGRARRPRAMAASASAPQLVQVSHRRPSYLRPRTAPRSRPWPRSASPPCTGMPAAPRPPLRQRPRAPTPRHRTTRRRHVQRHRSRARRARRARPCGRRARRELARAGGPREDRAHAARTAFGEYGSAQPGPEHHRASASACAERMIVPTLPGSSTPWR